MSHIASGTNLHFKGWILDDQKVEHTDRNFTKRSETSLKAVKRRFRAFSTCPRKVAGRRPAPARTAITASGIIGKFKIGVGANLRSQLFMRSLECDAVKGALFCWSFVSFFCRETAKGAARVAQVGPTMINAVGLRVPTNSGGPDPIWVLQSILERMKIHNQAIVLHYRTSVYVFFLHMIHTKISLTISKRYVPRKNVSISTHHLTSSDY